MSQDDKSYEDERWLQLHKHVNAFAPAELYIQKMVRCTLLCCVCVLPQLKPKLNIKLYETESGSTVFAGNFI